MDFKAKEAINSNGSNRIKKTLKKLSEKLENFDLSYTVFLLNLKFK